MSIETGGIQRSEMNNEQAKALFLDKFKQTQEWLREQRIPFLILGSLALSSYINYPIRFYRSNQRGFNRFPDIDLLIPRKYLPRVEKYGKSLLQGNNPINLELFSTYLHIDFRPDEEQSYLTHKKLRVPVSSQIFNPVTKYIEGIPTTTVFPETLFHTFVVCGGTLRGKDWSMILPLGRLMQEERAKGTGNIPEADFSQVHKFLDIRKEEYSFDMKMFWFGQTQLPKFPRLYNFFWTRLMSIVKAYNGVNKKQE